MSKLLLLLALTPSAIAATADLPPRWGHIRYDLNTMEYVMPKCEHSKVKKLSFKRENKRIVIRLECEPVPGEVNKQNPDLLEVR